MRTAHLDGDLLTYRAAFACQTQVVQVFNGVGDLLGEWKNKTLASEALGDLTDLTLKTEYIPEPIENCLHTVKSMIMNWTKGARCNKYKIYLDGDGNFRKELATIKPYKGNRTQPRPILYDDVREYMIKVHKAKVIETIENDDMLSIVQYGEFKRIGDSWENCKKVTVTVDKDNLNTPGWIFNPIKDVKPRFISELEAARNFFCQLVTGDPVDNIQGVPGKGTSSLACKLIRDLSDPTLMYKVAQEEYTKSGLDQKSVAENAKLLWMLREMPKSKKELMKTWKFEDYFGESV